MNKLIIFTTLVLATMALISQGPNISAANHLDTDHDGFISLEEAQQDQDLKKVFSDLDTDLDGYLSPTELKNQ